jgi:hypothetical protein
MSNQPDAYNSYLVRFWQECDGKKPEGGWRGEVESVQTSQKWQFYHLSDLLQFIQAQAEVHVSGSSKPGQRLNDPLSKETLEWD